ncbi:MAG TPA: M20/M25/M40 family metallo-hydrolase [Bryobacteraceae bacterium]|nr:M20/M25/M40 family metallo-hydrolase [Bryobacteraceae bacterium]
MKLLLALAFATALSAQTEKIVAQVSAERIASDVKTLAAFGTRASGSTHYAEARKWIFDQFKSYSPRFDVEIMDSINVVAILPGAVEPAKQIVVGAHYDSINLKDRRPEAPAPGADDDASGTALVLELARVMSQFHFRKTIVFVAFGGEEIGLVGSTRFAARAKLNKDQIEAMLNNDVVGSNVLGVTHNDIDGSDEATSDLGDTGNKLRVYSPPPDDSPSRRLAKTVQETVAHYVPKLRLDMSSLADRFGRSGDQGPFQQRGFPAVRFTSASENTGIQHTANDTPDLVSAPFVALVTQANAAAIATLAALVQ